MGMGGGVWLRYSMGMSDKTPFSVQTSPATSTSDWIRIRSSGSGETSTRSLEVELPILQLRGHEHFQILDVSEHVK